MYHYLCTALLNKTSGISQNRQFARCGLVIGFLLKVYPTEPPQKQNSVDPTSFEGADRRVRRAPRIFVSELCDCPNRAGPSH